MKDKKDSYDKYKEFFSSPEKYIPISDVGDLYLQWFTERYVALRLLDRLSIFEKAYKLLTERGNFSRKNAFGEMHCDGYLWIEKHPKIKVLVEERQSYKYIFIYDGYDFHIRALSYKWNYPAYRKNELKNITLKKFRAQSFEPKCYEGIDDRFEGFTYGDNRDKGYVLSANLYLKGYEKAACVDKHALFAIDSMTYWDYYLDKPEELE